MCPGTYIPMAEGENAPIFQTWCTALQIVNETIPALQKLKQEGLVKFIGITGYPLDIYTYVLDRSVNSSGA